MKKMWIGLIVSMIAMAVFADGKVAVVPEGSLPELIGPYLQNRGGSCMTVCLIAKNLQDVRVELKPAGSTEKQIHPSEGALVPDTTWTICKAALTNLNPGAEYEYRLRYTQDGKEIVGELHRLQKQVALEE